MDGLQRAKASSDWQKDGGRYIPYPATWLNNLGWQDEYQASVAQKAADTEYLTPEDLPQTL